MGVETAAAIALAAEASAGAAAAGTAGAALAGGAAASGALAGGAAAAGTAAGATAAGAGAASAAGAGLGAAEVAGAAAGAEAASAGGVAAAAGGVSPSSLALANTVSTFGGDGLSALIAAEGGFGSTSTMLGAAGDTFAGTAAGDIGKAAASNLLGSGGGQAPAAKPAANTGPQTNRPNQNPSLTQASQLMSPEFGRTSFENGGQVAEMFPDNIFARTRDRREQEAGLSGGGSGVTININSGSGSGGAQEKTVPRSEAQVPAFDQFANQLLNLIRSESKSGYADGGKVRDAESDVKAGGKIRGPQSKDGRDNQQINVAGGEGILPKDVMDVPGVSQMVQALIQTYHKPLK